MEDRPASSEAEAAMAAMGLPTNFSAPAFPKGNTSGGKGVRPPPPGPSNRGGRGRDGGWGNRGRGFSTLSNTSRPPSQTLPSGHPAMSGSPPQNSGGSRGGGNKRMRGRFTFQHATVHEGPLPALEDIPPLFRSSFIEEDPWSHLE